VSTRILSLLGSAPQAEKHTTEKTRRQEDRPRSARAGDQERAEARCLGSPGLPVSWSPGL